MVSRLILGVNPLVGVDHFSYERARRVKQEVDLRRSMEVIQAAIGAGASGFTFSPGSQAIDILKVARDAGETRPVKLYPVLPALEKYWPAFVARGTYGLVNAVLEDLSWRGKAKAVIRGGASALTSNPVSALRLYVDVELEKIRASSPSEWVIDTVFLGEMFTDLAVSIGALKLLAAYRDAVESHRDLRAGLQTRNFVKVVQSVKADEGFDQLPVIMAPFNPLGFQMIPDRESCEALAQRVGELEVVGISVLAAGQVSVTDAANYLKDKRYISSVAIGTSNPRHAVETFGYFRHNFATRGIA